MVVYLHKFPRHEAVDLEITQNHPNLISMPFSHFRWGSFKCQYLPYFHDKTFACLVELPAPEFIPLVNQIRKAGGVVVYDLLDDWQTSLGSGWYVPSIEEELISISDRLVATAPSLVRRLEVLTQRKVAYLPNAVNSHLFSPNRYYIKPHDLQPAEWYAIYVGALWGEWFDWELLLQIARAYPAAGVVVIGDYQHQFPDHPQNLHFLGLKPQKALPAYLHYANVALIPWKVNEVTQATSPLKVYEYIAMQKPIVAPSLQTLQDLPGVYLASDTADFVAKVGLLRSEITAKQDNRHFISANDWGARVREFLALITLPSFDIIPPEK